MGVNDRRRKFALEYVKNGFNGVQAVIASGYTKNYGAAKVTAHRLLTNANLRRLVEDHLKQSQISADEILDELSTMARAPVEKVSEGGKLKALELVGKANKMWADRLVLSTEEMDNLSDDAAARLGLPVPGRVKDDEDESDRPAS